MRGYLVISDCFVSLDDPETDETTARPENMTMTMNLRQQPPRHDSAAAAGSMMLQNQQLTLCVY